MLGIDLVAHVALNPVGEILMAHIRCDPIEQDVADRIGKEMRQRVSVEQGDLEVEIAERFLQRKNIEIGLLELLLAQTRGVEIRKAEGRERRGLSRVVGKPELAHRRA